MPAPSTSRLPRRSRPHPSAPRSGRGSARVRVAPARGALDLRADARCHPRVARLHALHAWSFFSNRRPRTAPAAAVGAAGHGGARVARRARRIAQPARKHVGRARVARAVPTWPATQDTHPVLSASTLAPSSHVAHAPRSGSTPDVGALTLTLILGKIGLGRREGRQHGAHVHRRLPVYIMYLRDGGGRDRTRAASDDGIALGPRCPNDDGCPARARPCPCPPPPRTTTTTTTTCAAARWRRSPDHYHLLRFAVRSLAWRPSWRWRRRGN